MPCCPAGSDDLASGTAGRLAADVAAGLVEGVLIAGDLAYAQVPIGPWSYTPPLFVRFRATATCRACAKPRENSRDTVPADRVQIYFSWVGSVPTPPQRRQKQECVDATSGRP